MKTVTSYSRGHKIYWDGIVWKYYNDDSLHKDNRPCIKCKYYPTNEGYDHCTGYIKNATSTCCGHGVEEPYRKYE